MNGKNNVRVYHNFEQYIAAILAPLCESFTPTS